MPDRPGITKMLKIASPATTLKPGASSPWTRVASTVLGARRSALDSSKSEPRKTTMLPTAAIAIHIRMSIGAKQPSRPAS
ncbi:MAG: hypothetical protein ACJAXA_003033, partial [Candidatus Aldehydirespiratoraceae bacterium]